MATLLTITNLAKSFGPHIILDDVNFSLAEGQKIGVIGRNGAGKSTFFALLTGQEEADHGTIIVHDGARLGFLGQHDEWQSGETAFEYLERLTNAEPWRVGKTAAAFEVNAAQLATNIEQLSGGYQMRIKLIGLFLADPNLLLLDEPTNYLDLDTQLLLQEYLTTFRGAHLIISHDREFLKHTCEQTLDVANGKLTFYPGGLEEYFAYREEVRLAAEHYNKNVERERAHLQEFVDRFRYKASKAKQAQSKLKQIARLETITIENPSATARIVIPSAPEKKGLALRTENLTIGYGEKTIAEKITFDIDRGTHAAILGQNGRGKTTLLKTLAGELPALGGRFKWSHNISVGYFAQHTAAMLDPDKTVFRHLEEQGYHLPHEELRAMAGNFLFSDDDIEKPIRVLSGGERSRLALAGLLLSRHDVLLLDEPTSHLDLETVEALAVALQAFNGTLLFVSHNRTFVNVVATTILEVAEGTALRYPYTYEEYVYHLGERREKPAQVLPNEPATTKSFSKAERYQEIKKLERERERAERELRVREEERASILRYFERYPTSYAPDKQKELALVSDRISELETRWFELEAELHALRKV